MMSRATEHAIRMIAWGLGEAKGEQPKPIPLPENRHADAQQTADENRKAAAWKRREERRQQQLQQQP